MNKVIIFLSDNNIPFLTFTNGKVYTISVSRANETQTNDLINLAEKEGLIYKLVDGMHIYEQLKEEAPSKKKK